jgi:hypothetical protein
MPICQYLFLHVRNGQGNVRNGQSDVRTRQGDATLGMARASDVRLGQVLN